MTKARYCTYFFALTALFLIALPAHAQSFGSSILVSDGEIFIGEPDNTYRSGAVYVYGNDGGEWVQRAEITSPDASMGDHFGTSIARAGDLLLVGSTGVDGQPGAAYLFRLENGSWSHFATLSDDSVSADDQFGAAVALTDQFAIVGAPAGEDAPGSAYVFSPNGSGEWTLQERLAGSVTANNAAFGAAIAANTTQAFIGAPRHNDQTGAVFVFDYDSASGSWTESSILEGRVVDSGDRFGSELALAGNELIVGIPRAGQRVGAAIIYTRSEESGEWTSSTLLLPFAAVSPPAFGSTIAVSEDEIWVGAPMGSSFTGDVFRFERSEDGSWIGTSRLSPDDLESRDLFGAELDVEGTVAAVALAGNDHGAGSVDVLEKSDDGTWEVVARLEGSAGGLEPITGDMVDCSEGSATMFDCERVDLLSFLPIQSLGGDRGVNLNDIWGWTDPVTNREYALVGRIDGTAFVDVTDPLNPVFLGDLPKTEGSPASSWRDIKVYKDHAFIVADNAREHGMQVFDLTQLRDVDNAPVTFEETAHYDRIHSAHNIVINTETGFAYTVGNSGGGETCGGGLHMINIQDPTHPTFAGCYSATGTGRAGTGYTHDAQCIVYDGPDSEYAGHEICLGSNETALNIADVSDKSNPINISTASYPNVSYTHQGWISDDHRYFYVNDELDELSGNVPETRTLIWDITDLDDPQLVKEYMWGVSSTDHNLYIRGDLMYQSNYESGLRIHDISDRTNPVEVGYFDTTPVGSNSPGFAGTWSNYPFFESGTIAVSSIGEGLFLLRKRKEVGL